MKLVAAITICTVAVFATESLDALAGDKATGQQKPNPKNVSKVRPDLAVELVGLPKRLAPGASLGHGAFAIVQNIGKGTLHAERNAFLVDVVLSSDPKVPKGLATYRPQYQEDVLLRGGRHGTIEDVASGVGMRFSLAASVIPKDTPPGKYQVCAHIDPQHQVDEAEEGNNLVCRVISITKKN